ncbi:MAG: TlpA family protein disulfide reductase [Woeseiaceae bacterium]
MPKTVFFIVALVCAIAGSIFFYYSQSNRTPVEPVIETVSVEPARSGPIHVEFELGGLDGEMRQFAEWDGKHRVVNFWATWCAPCRREIPLLKAFQDAHGPDDFQVIGIAVEFPEPVIAYAESAEFNYPILVGEQDAMAVAESSGISFIGLPFTMIVTKQGTLVGAHMGEIHQEHLDQIVIVLNSLDAGEIDLPEAKKTLGLL